MRGSKFRSINIQERRLHQKTLLKQRRKRHYGIVSYGRNNTRRTNTRGGYNVYVRKKEIIEKTKHAFIAHDGVNKKRGNWGRR
jgi:hypothetical protein